MNPRELPIYRHKNRILDALEKNNVIVVESPTGSGKTTQLPVILHEAGYSKNGVIGVTQPRRIAAVSVSEYIGRQLDAPVPGLVGYKMRFEDMTEAETRIKVMTDGILLQEMKADYMLSRYQVIMVDEAHERSLNIDFILGLLKRVSEERKDFKIIISSATINAEVFSEYFSSCPVVRIDAPMYPVEVIYDPPVREGDPEELLYKIASIVENEAKDSDGGHLLIFLSGERIIKECLANLKKRGHGGKFHILPLYGRLSKEEQDRVFPPAPGNKRKIVIATNIAETSITIDGVTAVIDPGLAKINYYNPRTFTESLIEQPISKASANQRKGRAGRTRPGTCYRLYSKEDFDARPLFTQEEIFRTDLSEVVLRMAELGIDDFERFDFISSPGRRNIHGAVETLKLLDALDPDNSLSQTGKMMAEFPLLPKHSRMIVEAVTQYPGVLEEIITATSFLTSGTPFLLPQGEEIAARKAHHRFRDEAGDFVSYLRLFRSYSDSTKKEKFCDRHYLDPQVMGEIRNVKEQLEQIVSEMGIPVTNGGSTADYLCAASKGLIQFVCRRTGKFAYASLTAQQIQIHPGSVMFRETPEFIVAGEIVKTTKMWARTVSPLQKSWLPRISPDLADADLFRGGKAKPGKKKRDTSWQVNIGPETFKLQPVKGKKKIAVLPWKKLKPLVRDKKFELPQQYNNLRGKVLYGNNEFLTGEKLLRIFKICRYIDPDRDIYEGWKRGKSYDSSGKRPALCAEIPNILKLTRIKKSGNKYGFLSLHTDGRGRYWLKSMKHISTAVTESLSSIETLIDELEDETDQDILETLNDAYRKLTTFYEL
jgi:RNA helicase HrpA